MRWDDQLLNPPEGETAKLPLFNQDAVIRRFDTPEFAGMAFYEVQAKSIINHLSHDRFGFRHTINPYRGCSHACAYCFARPTHTYLDFDAGKDFETKIVVKTNAPQLLRRELRRRSWSGEHIAMGTNTDNYQRAEGRYRLMRGILKELNAARNPYSILTKSTLIQRDMDLLVEGASATQVSTAFSIGTVDEEVWRRSEPGTPHPVKRLKVVRRLNEAGVRCGVLMAPILPGISDSPDQLKATVDAIAAAGATSITPITLYLRSGFREEFMGWLRDAYPELVTDYERMYRSSNAPKHVTQAIQQRVEDLKGSRGRTIDSRSKSHRIAPPKRHCKEGKQLSFGLSQ